MPTEILHKAKRWTARDLCFALDHVDNPSEEIVLIIEHDRGASINCSFEIARTCDVIFLKAILSPGAESKLEARDAMVHALEQIIATSQTALAIGKGEKP